MIAVQMLVGKTLDDPSTDHSHSILIGLPIAPANNFNFNSLFWLQILRAAFNMVKLINVLDVLGTSHQYPAEDCDPVDWLRHKAQALQSLGRGPTSSAVLQIEASGPRLPPGFYSLVLLNVTLPRANCTDLGLWSVQVGNSLNVTANPAGDVVENCPEASYALFSPPFNF